MARRVRHRVRGVRSSPSAARAEYVERVYAVTINGEAVSSGAVVLEAPDGAILIAGDDLDRWRANLAGKVPRTTRDARPFCSRTSRP